QNVWNDRTRWDLGVVGMGIVDWVVLPLFDVGCERGPVIDVRLRIVRLRVHGDEVLERLIVCHQLPCLLSSAWADRVSVPASSKVRNILTLLSDPCLAFA